MPDLSDRDWSDWQADLVGAIVLDDVQIAAIRGGVGSGKTAACVFVADTVATMRPGALLYLVMDTYGRLNDVHMPMCSALFPSSGAEFKASTMSWHYPNDAEVRLRAYFRAATQPGAKNPLEGGNIHGVIIDESGTFPGDEVFRRANNRARKPCADVGGAIRPPFVITSGFPQDPCWWVDATREAAAKGMRTREFYPLTQDNLANLSSDYLDRQRATLPEAEFEALVMNRPRPPAGQVLDTWRPDPYPLGNIIDGWARRPDHKTVATIDFGMRKPAVVALAFDAKLDAWVAFDEDAPDNCLTHELVRAILSHGWPLVEATCDPAGGARNAQTGRSDIDLIRRQPPDGLGCPILFETDAQKRDIRAGVIRMRKAIESRRLLITRELWERGMRAPRTQRTLARSILGYRYPDKGGGEPLKDGVNDHFIDALRYFAMRHLWHETVVDGRLPAALAPDSTAPRAAGLIHGGGRAWGR